MINRINYRNDQRNSDFEITDLRQFFATRPHSLLQKDFRLNFWVILYITGGSGFHSIDFNRYSYRKGDILFIRKNQVHHYEPNDEVEGYALHIDEPFFYRIKGFNGEVFLDFIDHAYGHPVLSFDTSPESTGRSLIDMIFREYHKADEQYNIELICALFQGFILSLKQQCSVQEKIFQSKDYENFRVFRKLLEENFSSSRSVDEYAQMMNLSQKTVNQATRKVAGLSAKQFIINRIILEIKRYLSAGELLNYEIADLMGFDEPANMTKFFMRYEGLSPKEFRKKLSD